MSRVRPSPKSLIVAALPAAIALLVIGNFAAYALFGANGLLALGDYRVLISIISFKSEWRRAIITFHCPAAIQI